MDAPAKCHGGIPHVVSPDSPTRIVSDTEFELAYVAADAATSLMLLLTREAALRAATAYRLCPSDIDGNLIRVNTKNEGAIIVPMTERLAAAVKAAAFRCGPDEPLLYGAGAPRDGYGAGEPEVHLGNLLRNRLDALQKRLNLSDWTWHDLRRTAAQRLYAAQPDLNVVRAVMGHKSILTTLHYLNAQKAPVTPAHVAAMAPKGLSHATTPSRHADHGLGQRPEPSQGPGPAAQGPAGLDS